jgi:hypothetical protein
MAKSIIDLTRGIPTTTKGWLDVFARINKFLKVSGDQLQIDGDIQLPPSAGNSVLGRSAATPGAPADIVAGGDGTFLRRTGATLGFTTISESDIPETIARDMDVTAAVSAHEGAPDPHPGYTTAAELASALSALNLANGTYTPTLTGVANVDATTSHLCHYLRVGSTVQVSGHIEVDATAAAATQVRISLPISSNLGAVGDCAGCAYSNTVASGAAILADATNDTALMEYVATDTANRALWFSFSYRII